MTQGKILEVSIENTGDFLLQDHLLGDSVLFLYDVANFDEKGGELLINGVVHPYLSKDDEFNTLVLGDTLEANYLTDEPVLLYPFSYEKKAIVFVEEEEDPPICLVPHNLYDRITDGVRDELLQETVLIQDDGEGYYISELVGLEVLIDGSYIDPASLPSTGNVTHRGDERPWPDGDVTHDADAGDIWFDTDDSNKQYIWDEDPANPGVFIWVDANYLDPAVSETIGGLVSDVLANTEQINDPTFGLSALLNQTTTTAQQANDLATTADGRISISDFEPSTEERVDGSLWFARTRQRTNFISNPSFEVDAAGWTNDASVTILREAASVEVTGSYALKITNNGATQEHLVEITDRMPVEEEQIITGSIYARLISGVGTDNFVRMVFRDNLGAELSTVDGARDGVQNVLATESWIRVSVTATAPIGAVDAYIQAVSGPDAALANDVWQVDGGVLEKSGEVGRYFDGDTYDADWAGTPHLSVSNMIGGKITDIFELDGSVWIEKFLAGSTLVDISATSITSGVLDGGLLGDESVPIDKIAGMPVVASEALAAGDLVNVYNDGGLSRVRKADANDLRPCTGFVLKAVAVDEIASVYSSGYNPFQSGMTPGPQFLSVTPGGTSDLPDDTVGNIIQSVGTAIDDVVLSFNASDPIRIT